MAGARGPVPKPQAQRRRKNKPEVPVTTVAAGAVDSSAPRPDDTWHPRARQWFDALTSSGQAELYQASDWAQAMLTADMISALVSAEKPSAQMFAAVLQSSSSLLVTEGERRRLRLELARGPQVDEDEAASVAAMADYRRRLG